MVVVVNGERRSVPEGTTVQDVVQLVGDARAGRGVAVAIEGEVVPRGSWSGTRLPEGARVEIVTAVQGG
jgi:sulfur carrier protein